MKILGLVLLCSFVCIKALALKPAKEYPAIPDSVSFPGWKSAIIKTRDGYRLAAWDIPPVSRNRKTTILIAGGDAGNMSNWLPLAQALSANGFRVLLFDYRGFGGSDDFKIDPDQLFYNEFREDLKAAIGWARRGYSENRLALYGFSMGTILAADVWLHSPADYFIAEGFVADPVIVQQRLFSIKGRRFKVPADASTHAQKLASLPKRMLLFAGTQDVVTTVGDCKALTAQRPGLVIKTFEGGHGGGFTAMMKDQFSGEYIDAITAFLSK